MLTTTVPPSCGQLSEAGGGLAEMLDAAPRAGLAVPCQANNPDLWFADSPTDLEEAKTLCVDCPVRAQCLAGAIDRHEPWGVWGGEIFERGVIISRKRPRGRPRKDTRVRVELPRARADQDHQEAAA